MMEGRGAGRTLQAEGLAGRGGVRVFVIGGVRLYPKVVHVLILRWCKQEGCVAPGGPRRASYVKRTSLGGGGTKYQKEFMQATTDQKHITRTLFSLEAQKSHPGHDSRKIDVFLFVDGFQELPAKVTSRHSPSLVKAIHSNRL